jgi:hypothetical protein
VAATSLIDLAKTGTDPDRSGKGAKVATVGLALSAISAVHLLAATNWVQRPRDPRSREGHPQDLRGIPTQAEVLKPARGIPATLGNGPVDRRARALIILAGIGWTHIVQRSPYAGALCCAVLNARVLIERAQTVALVGRKGLQARG